MVIIKEEHELITIIIVLYIQKYALLIFVFKFIVLYNRFLSGSAIN